MDWLKVIPNLFRELLEVIKEAQRMAGGYKRGQLVFWVSFILFAFTVIVLLALGVNPAFESISAVLSRFHISTESIGIPTSVFANLLLALLISIMYMVILIGIAGAIGAFLGMLIGIAIGGKTQDETEDTLNETITILREAKTLDLRNETLTALESLQIRAQVTQDRLHKRLVNKVARWSRRKKKEKRN